MAINEYDHDVPGMKLFRVPSARRSRTQPEDSIFYRSVVDIPASPQSESIIEWCSETFDSKWMRAGGVGYGHHDSRAMGGANPSAGPTGYYLDEPRLPVPSPRTILLTRTGTTTETENPSATAFTHPFMHHSSTRNQLRIEGGVAGRRRGDWLDAFWVYPDTYGDNPPFEINAAGYGGLPPDRHATTVWPTLRCSTETIDTTQNFYGWFETKVGTFTKYDFDSNDWPYFANGSMAGSNGGKVPSTTLIVTYDELARGWINHTMLLVVERYSAQQLEEGQPGIARWPCPLTDGEDHLTGGGEPGSALRRGGPFAGQIFRIRPDSPTMQNLHVYTPMQQTLLRGLRDYGAILMDKFGPSGTSPDSGNYGGPAIGVANDSRFGESSFKLPSTRWSVEENAFVPEENRVPIDDFEVVDLDPRPTYYALDGGAHGHGASNVMKHPRSWACNPPGFKPEPPSHPDNARYLITGNFGTDLAHARNNAVMGLGFMPDYIISTGDQVYSEIVHRVGKFGTSTYDYTVGRFYHEHLKGAATGEWLPTGGTAEVNKYFPCAGSADYNNPTYPTPSWDSYNNFFPLPYTGHTSLGNTGSKLYYDAIIGHVHLIVLDTYGASGGDAGSLAYRATQQTFVQNTLQASTATWKIVVLHDPPYTSGASQSPAVNFQWDFAGWGADMVLSAGPHSYERITAYNIPYVNVGFGGASLGSWTTILNGSGVGNSPKTETRFNSLYGVATLDVTEDSLHLIATSLQGKVVDDYLVEN